MLLGYFHIWNIRNKKRTVFRRLCSTYGRNRLINMCKELLRLRAAGRRVTVLSADSELILVEKKHLQVDLRLPQSQVDVAVGELVVAGLRWLPGREWTAHRQGERAHSSLHAGDVGLDLAQKPREGALQLISQKSKVTADTSQSLDRRDVRFYWSRHRQLWRRVRVRVLSYPRLETSIICETSAKDVI